MSASINALNGGVDYSGGALRWDGVDLAKKGFNQYKGIYAGFSISPELFKQFKAAWGGTVASNFGSGIHLATAGNYKDMCLYSALCVHGQTIFWGGNSKLFNYNVGKPIYNWLTSQFIQPIVYPNRTFKGKY